jgi:LmeA-like phospholipid-binding
MLFPFSMIVRRLLFLVLFLAVPLVAAEVVARKLLGHAVANAVSARIGGSPQVSFGTTPVLWQIIHGELNDVAVSDKHADLGGLPPMAVSASLHQIHITSVTSLDGAVGRISIHAGLPPRSVLAMLATPACIESLPASVVGGLTDQPRVLIFANHISVLPPSGRAAELRLSPAAIDGSIDFRLIGLIEDGENVSSASLDSVAASVTCTRSAADLPFNLRLVSARARPGVLRLGFSAGSASFSALG